MSAGLWRSRASDWILVARGQGEILNGHHSLSEVVRPGTTQRFFIAFLTFPDGVREW